MIITNRARQLSVSLSKLDMSAIDDGERQPLFDELSGLKKIIDHMLENVGAPTFLTNPDELAHTN